MSKLPPIDIKHGTTEVFGHEFEFREVTIAEYEYLVDIEDGLEKNNKRLLLDATINLVASCMVVEEPFESRVEWLRSQNANQFKRLTNARNFIASLTKLPEPEGEVEKKGAKKK